MEGNGVGRGSKKGKKNTERVGGEPEESLEGSDVGDGVASKIWSGTSGKRGPRVWTRREDDGLASGFEIQRRRVFRRDCGSLRGRGGQRGSRQNINDTIVVHLEIRFK